MAQQQPRYQEIADELRRQIESGELGRESQLPTGLSGIGEEEVQRYSALERQQGCRQEALPP